MDNEQISRSGSSAFGSTRSNQEPAGSAAGWQDVRAKAGDAVSKFTEVAQQAGSQAKQTAASLASDTNQKAKGLLNQQLAVGADLAANVAESAKCAADNLSENAPQLADLVRGAADKIEGFSRDMRGRSVEDVVRTASDFTRRQPALVFGLASLAGFCLFRVLKADSSNDSYSFQQQNPRRQETRPGSRWEEQRFGEGAGRFHGT
jgi:ElaB/YqjD/DUF883 family membrane-anchored ribosome-binding protein